MALLGTLRTVIVAIAAICVVFAVSVYGCLVTPLRLLRCGTWRGRRMYRDCMAVVQGWWLSACSLCLPAQRMVVRGDVHSLTSNHRPKVFIMNHQTDTDWLYLWFLAHHLGVAGRVKIMLKAALVSVPILGWGLRHLEFLPVRRRWDEDKGPLNAWLKSFCDDGFPLWLLMFPEGTTAHVEAVQKSAKFGAETGRHTGHKLLLLPRYRGFEACIEGLAKAAKTPDDLPEIVDLTTAFGGYSGEVPTYDQGYTRRVDKGVPNWASLLTGERASECHMRVKTYQYEEIAKAGGAQAWLDALWIRKELAMSDFVEQQQFLAPDPAPTIGMPAVSVAEVANRNEGRGEGEGGDESVVKSAAKGVESAPSGSSGTGTAAAPTSGFHDEVTWVESGSFLAMFLMLSAAAFGICALVAAGGLAWHSLGMVPDLVRGLVQAVVPGAMPEEAFEA